MSIQALSWCVNQKCDTTTTKLILFILSNYADENQSCYPSEKHIAKLAGVSDRTVRRSLRYLEDFGLLRIKHQQGTSNRYFLSVDTHVQPPMDTTVQTLRTPVTNNTKGKTKDIYSAEFEEFWKVYPRKENKRESFKKWKKAVEDITEKKLLVYTIRFAEKVQRDNTQEKYIPHPTTWLNQGRYEDFKKIETKNSLNNIAG
jgi:DNA-binding transcriptional regulator YhcF (GntR family)